MGEEASYKSTTAVVQARADRGPVQGSNGTEDEKWMDSGCGLNIDPNGFGIKHGIEKQPVNEAGL